ncbi:alpha/beta hydrolase [Lysobacter solisilvae (ex Woo and Kim 2020)]|uniref:Alpha/beta hydrolase n=1 Tax=Agrilutibacter terrestris TaxID=2865112 RepID=A0A7H0FX68_9GAMM|nr:alpha/beta hydrolase [Lysobacter terrestris]QNP40634.1 alpha/beta hydrolase [Lysobacter terrestris]
MAAVISNRTPSISTIVRNVLPLYATRLEFLLGAWLAPEAVVRKAAHLFTRPFASSRSRALAAPTLGAAELELDVDGTRIHAYVWGDPRQQPYVLFAHGWSSHGTRVASWLQPLRAAGYAVVAFDQAGHGRSSGTHTTLPDFTCHLLAVARHFGPAAALIGHSFGGAASALALARGLEAQRAILIAPAADPLAAVERFSSLVWLPAYLGRRMFARFEQAMRFEADELQAHNNVQKIGRPALIVHDVEDREVPWSEGERYARFWRDSRLLSTRGLGHNRIADDAGVIAAALRFLRGEEVGERVVSSPNLPYGFA